jgi:hypothetical protein
MMVWKKNLAFALVFLLVVFLVSAAEFIPQGNVNGVGIRQIYNFTYVNATRFYQDGSPVLTSANVSGYVQNSSLNTTLGGNLTFAERNGVCFNENCSSHIVFNGSHTVITG